MHKYLHHIGDFTRDTVHLEPVEECYYRRALDLYYKNEMPLDPDVNEVCRLLRAKTGSQKKAVQTILKEFFTLEEDGFHQYRCDHEIAEYTGTEPERIANTETKKANARERKRRNRERRSDLFKFLRDHNIVPPFNIKAPELQALVDDVTNRTGHAPVTRDHSVTGQDSHSDVTGQGTANHNQKPLTSNPNNSLSNAGGDGQDGDVTANMGLSVTPSQLPELGLSQDPRMVTWSQLNYESLPEHWKQVALKAYPELNEASLKAMFVSCAGKCAGMPGRQQPQAKWDAEWSYTVGMLAEEKLASQSRLERQSQKPAATSSSKNSNSNRQVNQSWEGEEPNYDELNQKRKKSTDTGGF